MCAPENDVKKAIINQQRKRQTPLNLAICAFGICSCYLCYGMLHESIMSKHRMGAAFVLIIQCISNSIVAYIWQTIQKSVENKHSSQLSKDNCSSINKPENTTSYIDHRLMLITTFCYVTAMTSSNEALAHVSYPTVILAKSCKMIPTMLMGALVERKKYQSKEWLAAFFITFGIVIFNVSRATHKKNKKEVNNENSVVGLSLLFLSLSMDGLLGSCQGLLKKPRITSKNIMYRPPSAVEMMLYMNLYSLIFLLPLATYTNQLHDGIALIMNTDDIANGLVLLHASVAAGQIFIFLTVSWFSSLVCTTITTTRKFFTILLSVLYFGHSFTVVEWTAVLSIFSGLYLGITAQRDNAKAVPVPLTKKVS